MSESPENKYGTTPYSPTVLPNVGQEPRSAKLTKMLVWPLLALHMISAILLQIQLTTTDAQESFLAAIPPEQLEQLSPEMLDRMGTIATIFNIGTAVLTLVLFVIVGLGLRGNRTWARFIGLVLAILFVLMSAYSLLLGTDYGNLPALDLLLAVTGWLAVLLTIWWLVQAMSKTTAQWFALHRRIEG